MEYGSRVVVWFLLIMKAQLLEPGLDAWCQSTKQVIACATLVSEEMQMLAEDVSFCLDTCA